MSVGCSTWVIVLAAGEGLRLRSLTTDRGGRSVPKQFCSLRGGRSLFGDAVARARRIACDEQIVSVVAAHHREHWRDEVTELPSANVLVQPSNRGTAAGILLPLLAIHERDPGARVVVLPSDHHVREEDLLEQSLREALADCEQDSRSVALLGIEPEGPESDYGWIVPGPRRAGWRRPRSVAEFVEKPDRPTAHELLSRGGLWNSFLLAGLSEAFLELYARHLPELLSAFATAFLAHEQHRPAWLGMLYSGISPADFSRDVLQHATPDLSLTEVPACGWTDLGTPERVARCLRAMSPGPRPEPASRDPLVLAHALAVQAH